MTDIPTKRCSKKEKCIHLETKKGWLPATTKYFRVDKYHSDGLHSWCRVCERAVKRQRRATVPEKKREEDRERRAANPEKYRAQARQRYANDLEKKREQQRQLRAANPEKHRKQQRQRYADHPEKQCKRSGKYQKDHPEKVRIYRLTRLSRKRNLPDDFTPADWQRALNYFGDCCAVCERPPGLRHTLAADHWIPLSSPECPGTVPTNIVPLCHGQDGCNNSKYTQSASTWLARKFGNRKAREILSRIEAYFEWLQSEGAS